MSTVLKATIKQISDFDKDNIPKDYAVTASIYFGVIYGLFLVKDKIPGLSVNPKENSLTITFSEEFIINLKDFDNIFSIDGTIDLPIHDEYLLELITNIIDTEKYYESSKKKFSEFWKIEIIHND